ncbi:DUF503 domain-containing protein [candidate division TA06 bacterium]|uniref:DUF503 domain-containing protein n=1 Tax=candidate division TA06 bacterium TaxID=2250710 RepID=A0A660SPP1_UNCT6|nr:MAG: DUF503 domain-containing protein [candidate division TA06 bacterium]
MLLYLELDLFVNFSQSLKDKRHVVQSIKSRLKSKFNISIREIDPNDKWQITRLAIAYIGNDRKEIENTKRNIQDLIYSNGSVEISSVREEIL